MRIRFSPLIASASGKAADAVASSWKGRAYIRKLVIPHNPKSPAQVLVRESLARCVTLWRSLATYVKLWLNTYARDYGMAGYNTFMKVNRVLEQASDVLKPVPDNPYTPAPSTFAAVTGIGVAGDIDITWVDNSPTAMDRITLVARLASGAIFNATGLPLAANLSYTFSGLDAGADYDIYGWFYNSLTDEAGTTAGVQGVTSKA